MTSQIDGNGLDQCIKQSGSIKVNITLMDCWIEISEHDPTKKKKVRRELTGMQLCPTISINLISTQECVDFWLARSIGVGIQIWGIKHMKGIKQIS